MGDDIHKTHFTVPEMPWKKSVIKIVKQSPKQNGCIQDIYHTEPMYEIRLEKENFASVFTLCGDCLYDLYREIKQTFDIDKDIK